MRARVDAQTCQSSGNCLRAEPEVFEWDDDHLARVKADAPPREAARLAEIARNCPAMAIVLVDEGGGEVDPYSLLESEG
jgi:ferredoxin